MSLPVFRISAHNATLLSALYLAIATVLEGIRRIWNPRWTEKACLAMEAFPARALDVVGLLEPIKHAYAWGNISEMSVRLVFGVAPDGGVGKRGGEALAFAPHVALRVVGEDAVEPVLRAVRPVGAAGEIDFDIRGFLAAVGATVVAVVKFAIAFLNNERARGI